MGVRVQVKHPPPPWECYEGFPSPAQGARGLASLYLRGRTAPTTHGISSPA